MIQTVLDFDRIVHTRENSRSNEIILNGQRKRLSNNCKKIYDALISGERLTGMDMMRYYNITEYRKRIAELKKAGLDIQEKILNNGAKQWFI